MRIVSGKHKSKRIHTPKNLPVRPTTDMAKESLFNILNNLYCFNSISVADLFAGTGNISYEFASRGTKIIYAVDTHYGCIKFINQIAKELGFNITVFKSDVFTFLEKTSIKTDIIFADPPYNLKTSEFLKIADLVFEKKLLNKEGTLIIEHSKHTDISSHSKLTYEKRYGRSVFSFFEL